LDQLFYIKVQNILDKNMVKIQTQLQQERLYDIEESKASHCHVRPHKFCGIPQAAMSLNIKARCHQQPFGKRLPNDVSVSFSSSKFFSSLPFRQKQLSERPDVVIVGLLILGGNGMPDKDSTASLLRKMGGRAFLSSINVFVFDILERSSYFIYHEV